MQRRAGRAAPATSSTTWPAELPLQAIADLLGVPQEDRRQALRLVEPDDRLRRPRAAAGDAGRSAAAEILGYSMAMAEDRRGSPRDDIVTKLVSAEIDGHGLTDDEFGFFVMMLAVAGNETTRNAITHGMNAFFDHPEQWELFKARAPGDRGRRDRPLGHPGHRVPAHRDPGRRARRPADQGGRAGRACSTGRPTSTRKSSTSPDGSTSRRSPNPHLGFGGLGTHYCLGASLAKLEIELIFNAIADAMPDIAKAGDPRRLRSGWINGIKSLPVTYRP